MLESTLLRYSRHILLDEFGFDGQHRVSAATVLVVGMGGLGSPVALYLAAAGVGRLVLVDDDTVDVTNLQRQIAHTTGRIGEHKVDSAALAAKSINPEVVVETHARRADLPMLLPLVAACDIVIDCSDNFATRHVVNRACVAGMKPLIAGSAVRFDGQLSVYDPSDARSPCYACIFPEDAIVEETRCAVMGVFAPVVAIVGSLQAHEALKLIAAIGQSLVGTLLMFDGLITQFDRLSIVRDPNCSVCASRD